MKATLTPTESSSAVMPILPWDSPCMDKLDDLGWSEGLAIHAYGVRFGVRVSEPGFLSQIEALLPPGATVSADPDVRQMFSFVIGGPGERANVHRLFLLYRGILQAARHRQPEPVLDALKSEIRLWIAERAPRRVFVHAGVVEWQGRAIVVPGRSYSGKSTLVSELLKAGATYYSDEYAILDAEGRVHPFPLPLSIRQPGEVDQVEASPESFGARTGRRSIPVGAVAVGRFREGAQWRPRSVTKGEGVLALMANTVSARRSPERVMATLRTAVSGAVVLKGTRGEASEAAARLMELSEVAS